MRPLPWCAASGPLNLTSLFRQVLWGLQVQHGQTWKHRRARCARACRPERRSILAGHSGPKAGQGWEGPSVPPHFPEGSGEAGPQVNKTAGAPCVAWTCGSTAVSAHGFPSDDPPIRCTAEAVQGTNRLLNPRSCSLKHFCKRPQFLSLDRRTCLHPRS